MAIEIERKFLVRDDRWREEVVRSKELRQAYLAKTDRISTRVRIVDNCDATLTVKSTWRGRARDEFEYPIPVLDAERLMSLRRGSVVEKVRHEVPAGDLTWEVDVFFGDNDGLIVAEIELDREDRSFELPEWLGPEVTSDPRYGNASLALRPFRDWTLQGDADDDPWAVAPQSVAGD